MYRERSGDPAFWAEPMNALTNASFIIAAAFALDLVDEAWGHSLSGRRSLGSQLIRSLGVTAYLGAT